MPAFPVKTSMVLRPAAANDFEALLHIRIEGMRESLQRIGRFDPARARQRFLDGFDPACTRRIEVAGELIGFVVFKRRAEDFLLDHLYLLPKGQGAGIGSEVLACLFEEADALRLPIRVGALKESASNRFYLRHGFQFVESGEFDNYYVRPSSSPAERIDG